MGKSNKKVLLLAILFSGVSTFLLYQYLQNFKAAPQTLQTVKVLVANQMIPAKTTISKNMIKEADIPKEYVLPQALVHSKDVLGMITTDKILEGEQLLGDRFSNEQNAALAFKIPEKHRAVAIGVNEVIEVANLISPGDYIDVIATLEKEDVDTGGEIISYPKSSKIILENVLILAVGQQLSGNELTVKELPNTVTLALLPEQAEQLVLAEEMGKIRLALRRVEDQEIIATKGAVRQDISTDQGIIRKQNPIGSGGVQP